MARKTPTHRKDGKPYAKTIPDWREIREIKRLLGLPSRVPLPHCPAKSKSKCKKLNRQQDPDWERKKRAGEPFLDGFTDWTKHTNWCQEVGCSHTAGYGTDHYGYGWCKYHEGSRMNKGKSEEFALRHRNRLIAGHPVTYSDPGKWAEKVEQDTMDLEKTVVLRGELRTVRGLLQEVMEMMQTTDPDPEVQQKTLTARVNAVTKLMKEIRAIAIDDLALDQQNSISEDDFRTYVLEIFRIVNRTLEKVPPEDAAKVVKEIREVPEPKRGVEKKQKAGG